MNLGNSFYNTIITNTSVLCHNAIGKKVGCYNLYSNVRRRVYWDISDICIGQIYGVINKTTNG